MTIKPADFTIETATVGRERIKTLWVKVGTNMDRSSCDITWPGAAGRFNQLYRTKVIERIIAINMIKVPVPSQAHRLDLSAQTDQVTVTARYPHALGKGHTWQYQADGLRDVLVKALNEAVQNHFAVVQHMQVHSMLMLPKAQGK